MISIATGNLLHAPAEALVNTVNTEGVMGKGIALQFKRAYPRMFQEYLEACRGGRVTLGHVQVCDNGSLGGGPRWIINFPTKGHWKSRSRLADIEQGLADLVRAIRRLEIKSIAIPPLGCGNGGLDWRDVRPKIEEALAEVPEVQVLLFPPDNVPIASEMPNVTAKPALTVGRAALIQLVKTYECALLGSVTSLLEVHKLMYFLQEAGEKLALNYKAHTYGPYALNLRHVLTLMEGHYLTGFGDGADTPTKPIELVDGAAAEAEAFLASRDDVIQRLHRVGALIEGFEDPYGMELLSSTHWVLCHTPGARESSEIATAAVREWNPGKRRRLKPEHLQKAWTRLKDLRWDTESRSAIR